MEDEIKKRLIESFDQVKTWVEAGTNFTAEQAPLVIQEIVKRGIIVETWEVILCIAFATSCLFGLNKIRGISIRPGSDAEDFQTFGVCTSYFGIFLFTIVGVANLADPFLIWFAPRLYVLEQLSIIIGKVTS